MHSRSVYRHPSLLIPHRNFTRSARTHNANFYSHQACPHGCTCGIPLGLPVDGGLSGCAPVDGGGGDDSEPPAAASPPSVAAPLKPPGAGVGALPGQYAADRTEEAHLRSDDGNPACDHTYICACLMFQSGPTLLDSHQDLIRPPLGEFAALL